MKIVCESDLEKRERFDLLVLPFFEGPVAAADVSRWNNVLSKPLESGDFKGKLGEMLLLYEEGRILALGLGPKDAVNKEVLRRAYSCAVRTAQAKKAETLHVLFPRTEAEEDAFQAIVDSIFLTNYAFTQLKKESLKESPVVLLKQAILIGVKAQDKTIAERETIAAGVHFVRELVNGNADDVTPQMLAETAVSLAKETRGLTAKILDKKQIEKEKMGLLLAVNRGASTDPYLVILEYRGNPKSKDNIVLVGKGITYDTGGLDLKTAEGMLTMKDDMAGAATVLSAVQVAAALNLPVNVAAVAPVTENAIDAKSYKMGDVYSSMSGKTVEITNTDAEGRLVLADAITYAIRHLQPRLLVDVASLTGGIIIALGEEISGLFSNNDGLSKDLLASSAATGELLWRMPLHADYHEMLKSEIADLVNSAGKSASSMTAALFIEGFVEKIPWAHIDFAGSCYLSKPKFYNTSKATGFGVRLLVDFLTRRSE